MRINSERLLKDLTELGQIGYRENHGVTRLALTDDDLRARAWLKERMEDAGLTVRLDPCANQIGSLPCQDSDQPVLILGSHRDTVPEGGPYDGALGVLGGLECARTLQEEGVTLPWDLEIINFTDEEGHRYAGTLGSRAMMGLLAPAEIWKSRREDVEPIGNRLSALGLDPDRIETAQRSPDAIRGYLELHIEQGSVLESRPADVGVVTGIVGIYRYVIEVLGRANHAGTTPMAQRADALVAAAPAFHLLPEWARARSENMVATIGQIEVAPGGINIIPGLCRFSVELRSLCSRDMEGVRDRLTDWLDENVPARFETVFEKDGVTLDSNLREILHQSAVDYGLLAHSMPSGAGHDAQSFAPYVSTGMLFVPSQEGISHSPQEYSEPRWLINGVQTLLGTVLRLAAE